MWQYDFEIFYLAGQAVLTGVSPYAHWDFNSPFPFAVLFAPFALLPQNLAYAVYLALNLGLLWKVMGRKAVWPLLSFPVLFGLFVGQVDLLLALLAASASPWALAVLIIKPQVMLVLFPFFALRMSRPDWLKCALGLSALLGLSFMLRPGWMAEWAATRADFVFFSQHASNLYWLVPLNWPQLRAYLTVAGALLALLFAVRLHERQQSWLTLHLWGPLTNVYSPSVLAEWIGPREVLLSWLAIFWVGGHIHSGAPLFLMGVSIWLRWRHARLAASRVT